MTLVNSVEIEDDGDAKDLNENYSISKLSANKPSSLNSN